MPSNALILPPPGPRVLLRHWRADDYAAYAALNADAQVMQYFPRPLDRAASDAMADEIGARMARQGWGIWAAEHTATGNFIGAVGLNIPSAPLPFQPCVEIAWRLAKPWWGQGLALEAATQALQHGFEHLQLNEVVAFTALPNLRSQALMQRLGMQRKGPDFEHPVLPAGHWLRRHCLYAIERSQWLSRAPAR